MEDILHAQPPLATNIVMISTKDGQQPKKDIQIKLPVQHTTGSDNTEMCVLATSKDDPVEEHDWDIIDAVNVSGENAISFNISHFSV